MSPLQNPTIYLGSLRIDELITTLTDFVLGAVCFFAFFKTKQLPQHKAIHLYRWFFLVTGLTTTLGAITGHAFLYYFGIESKIYGWTLGLIGATFAPFAALYHTRTSISESLFKTLFIVCSAEAAIAFTSLFVYWSFIVVEIHTAFALLIILASLEFIHYKKTKSKLSLYMMYGVGIAVLAIVCFVTKLAFSVWFNHMDLSHLFMAVSMYIMYKGTRFYQPITQN